MRHLIFEIGRAFKESDMHSCDGFKQFQFLKNSETKQQTQLD